MRRQVLVRYYLYFLYFLVNLEVLQLVLPDLSVLYFL
jgi:hypothetical protein